MKSLFSVCNQFSHDFPQHLARSMAQLLASNFNINTVIMADLTQFHFCNAHTWATQDTDGSWLVGISDYAQQMLGDVVFIDPPAAGSQVTQDQVCGLVESVKTGSDLYAPLSGLVLAVNEAVLSAPEKLNDQPYVAWIFRLDAAARGVEQLLDAEAYLASVA